MTFSPQVNIIKSGDRLTVLVRQPYFPRSVGRGCCSTCDFKHSWLCRGCKDRDKKPSYRWVYANWFSLKELKQIEKEPYKIEVNKWM